MGHHWHSNGIGDWVRVCHRPASPPVFLAQEARKSFILTQAVSDLTQLKFHAQQNPTQ